MPKQIHLVCDIWEKDVVRSVLKHYHVMDSVRVCKPGGKPFWSEDDTLVVWHGKHTNDIVLFYYISKVAPSTLYEVDYSHVDQYAEMGYSPVSIGDKAIVKARCGKTISPVSEEKRREAASNWDRLSEKPLPLYLMGEDGVIRNYPKDYLKDWLLGIARISLQEKKKILITHIIGSACGHMIASNDNALPSGYCERIIHNLAETGQIEISDGKYLLNNEFLQQTDISWFKDGSNPWAHYRQWKENQI